MAHLLRKGASLDQREIDFQAGYFAAWKDILDKPDAVEGDLERALRRVERESETP